ncbi:hypothetical protein ACLOAV_010658 [Pseudogymnoascus australis]
MLKNGSGTPQSTPEAELDVSDAERKNLYGKHCRRTSAFLRYHQAASENRQNLESCLNDLHDVCSHLEKKIKGICETYDSEKSQLQQEIAQCEDKNDDLEAILASLREENRVAKGLIATQSRVIDTLQAQHHPELQNMNGLAQHGLMLSDCVETSGQYGPYAVDYATGSQQNISYSVGTSESPSAFLHMPELPSKTALEYLLQPPPASYATSADRDADGGRTKRENNALEDGLISVDRVINLHHGSTTALEATHERLEASKQFPVPTFKETIAQLEKQGSNLHHEAIYFRQMEPIRKRFKRDISLLVRELNDVLSKSDEIEQEVDYERVQLSQTPHPSPVDRIISLYCDHTIDIEATPRALQGSKQNGTLNSPEKIEQLQRKNGSLAQEVAYLRQMEPSKTEFKDNVTFIARKLEHAVSRLGKSQRKVDNEWIQLRQDSSADI